MISRINLLFKEFRLNKYVKSALASGIIARSGNEVGINKSVFVKYIDIVPPLLREDFVNRISDIALDAKMNLELEIQNKENYINKVSELFVDIAENCNLVTERGLPVGNVMFDGKR